MFRKSDRQERQEQLASLHAFRSIARTEGLRGLYSGMAPTVQRASIVAAVELALLTL